jgi:saccharopine dehydrogenase-like NADP-dependent oxidoreductase
VRAVLIGTGAVGSRAARQLASTDGLDELVLIDTNRARAQAVADALDRADRVRVGDDAGDPQQLVEADVVVLALPSGHRALAESAMEQGAHVVSTTDDCREVRSLLDLDAEARERALSVVVGTGFSPGLSCVLARHGAAGFDTVDEIHVAKAGTGGPACARQHHRALTGDAIDWRDGAWTPRPGGSGRELCWFPEPVGAQDCYRAALSESMLVVPAFPGVQRVTARVAATRRDRLTSWMPMLRPPHPEGVVGAVRVEVRGRRGAVTDAHVLGAIDRPAVAAGALAAVAAAWTTDNRLARAGAGGLAELLDDPVPFLQELARRGVKAAVFEGA